MKVDTRHMQRISTENIINPITAGGVLTPGRGEGTEVAEGSFGRPRGCPRTAFGRKGLRRASSGIENVSLPSGVQRVWQAASIARFLAHFHLSCQAMTLVETLLVLVSMNLQIATN